MIQEPTLRKWHRYAGVALAPLILLQAVSGLFLSIEWLAGLHTAAGELLPGASPLTRFWDWVFVGVHYPSDVLGGALIGLLVGWLVVTGWREVARRWIPQWAIDSPGQDAP